jgi:hypothetical protein
MLYDSFTKVAGVMFFVSATAVSIFKIFRKRNILKKEVQMKPEHVISNLKNVLTHLFHNILGKVKIASIFLKRTAIVAIRFLYRSRTKVLFITTILLATLLVSFLLASWFYGNNYAYSDMSNDGSQNGDYDRTVSTRGNVVVQGLEIYGGDTKYDPKNKAFYVDWGELSLGAYKNVSFIVKSTSNIDVTLTLNVTNWSPPTIDEFISVYWNYTGTVLTPSRELPVTATLEVAASGDFIDFLVGHNVTSFGFDMTVYATGEGS